MPTEQPSIDLPEMDEHKLIADIMPHLQAIYPDASESVCANILKVLKRHKPATSKDSARRWSENDILLITYGDSIIDTEQTPLRTLDHFINKYLQDCISDVHILPFFPYSSDDGFSVIDYRKVNPELGNWKDIRHIAAKYKLMADLVINHVSKESLWFYDYVADKPPGKNYFIELDPDTDVSQVTRPRNTPLLASVNTHRGIRYVWATFSEDQIDLNFANPDVLIEFIDILLFICQFWNTK